jgi:ABC-2 type transport system permease protein
LTVDVQSTEARGFRSLTVAQYASAGELILFVFLIALVSAGELVDTRRLGISRRMLVSPATPRQVVVGEGLNRFLTAALQALVIAGVTALVFQLSWGNPIGVGLVISAFALVSVGAGLLMGTIARTTEQATSLGPVVGIALGMLGGCMWPLEVVPSQLRTIGHLTPHAWALDALIRLMGEGGGPADVVGPVSMLVAFAVLLVPIAAWRLKHSIVM